MPMYNKCRPLLMNFIRFLVRLLHYEQLIVMIDKIHLYKYLCYNYINKEFKHMLLSKLTKE